MKRERHDLWFPAGPVGGRVENASRETQYLIKAAEGGVIELAIVSNGTGTWIELNREQARTFAERLAIERGAAGLDEPAVKDVAHDILSTPMRASPVITVVGQASEKLSTAMREFNEALDKLPTRE